MSGLAALLAGREDPGVWRWVSGLEVDDVRAAVQTAGWDLRYLDAAGVVTKAEFLVAVGESLGFPDTYGANVDALADLLDDVTAERGTVLLWDAWGGFARGDERWFTVCLHVLGERARDTSRSPFAVLLRGAGPGVPGLRLLE